MVYIVTFDTLTAGYTFIYTIMSATSEVDLHFVVVFPAHNTYNIFSQRPCALNGLHMCISSKEKVLPTETCDREKLRLKRQPRERSFVALLKAAE